MSSARRTRSASPVVIWPPIATAEQMWLMSSLGRLLRYTQKRSCQAAADLRAVDERQAAAVIRSYVAAVNARDLEGILALYADDAIRVALPTPDGSAGVCVGKEQVRLFYQQRIADRERIEVVDGTLDVDGERVTFVVRSTSAPWTALGLGLLEANVEAVIVQGRITTHVAILTPGSIQELLVAQGTVPGAAHTH